MCLTVGPAHRSAPTVLHPFQITNQNVRPPELIDTNTAWIMDFHDPDGLDVEVIWQKPGTRAAETLRHENRTTVQLS